MKRIEKFMEQCSTEEGMINFVMNSCNPCNFCKRELCCAKPRCKTNVKLFLSEEVKEKGDSNEKTGKE